MTDTLLDQLEARKRLVGTFAATELESLLTAAADLHLTDANDLIRLHETLLFFRAYPPTPAIARLTDAILFSFADRVSDIDSPAFAEPEVSGIAGTRFSAVFSYEVVQRLAALHGREIDINWDEWDTVTLGAVMSRFVPLLREDWPVEANVPYRAWLEHARPPKTRPLDFLLDHLRRLKLPPRDQATLYDSLQLPLTWELGNSTATRSRLRLPGAGKLFLHDKPLLKRGDVSLEVEIAKPPLPMTQLSPTESQRVLDLILETSAVRYRELYGFSHPDTKQVWNVDFGRGVRVYLFGVPPEWRLPLRAYHSALFFKNGVPIGYVEILSLFDRSELGFNVYYTFREGESAWLYSQVLRLLHHWMGINYFSVDPYQLGHHNKEAVDSGAFWFYRKLGFRPVEPAIARLTEREEEKIRMQRGYRTSPGTLKKLASGYMVFEAPGAQRGLWDQFQARNVAMSGAIPIKDPDIVRAKRAPDERRYLRLLQRNPKLRDLVLKCGAGC
jgi:hypothetical protein